jgi:putative transposase
MPRTARVVLAGVPHHVTQRGNRRQDVFFSDGDRAAYLGWLAYYCQRFHLEVLAYCLMSNHVHLVIVPESESALEQLFRPLHTRYAQRVNRGRGWSGHLWQGRYFSSALDERYLWASMRYVERNPVRACIVCRAQDYRWSSAPAHCKLVDDYVLTRESRWVELWESVGDWSHWLSGSDGLDDVSVLRRNVERGLPCGSDGFVSELERRTGLTLRSTPRGRPMKNDPRASKR